MIYITRHFPLIVKKLDFLPKQWHPPPSPSTSLGDKSRLFSISFVIFIVNPVLRQGWQYRKMVFIKKVFQAEQFSNFVWFFFIGRGVDNSLFFWVFFLDINVKIFPFLEGKSNHINDKIHINVSTLNCMICLFSSCLLFHLHTSILAQGEWRKHRLKGSHNKTIP